MGCCEPVDCEILTDDFSRTSLETLTFSSQSAHSSGYGYVVTMTSTPSHCAVGDTLSGTSQMDDQEYSYYVKAVSGDDVTVEFLFVETPDETLDPDPETQGIETFTVKRLGSNYAGADSTQPANYLWGVCSFGLVKSNDTGQHGDVTWLEIVPLYQKPNVIISVEQNEVNTSATATRKTTEFRTMAGDDALASTNAKGYNGFAIIEPAGNEELETWFLGVYEETPDFRYAVERWPWGNVEISAFDSDRDNTLSKTDAVEDNVIKVHYCQKQFLREQGDLLRPSESFSERYRFLTMTLKIGERLNPSLFTMMTGWDKAVSPYANGRNIGDKAYLFSAEKKQVLRKLTIQHNDVGVSRCQGCFTDLELNCEKLTNEYAYVNMEKRGAAQTLIDGGFGSAWSVSGDNIVGTGAHSPKGFCNGLLPQEGAEINQPPNRGGFAARFYNGLLAPAYIGESHGLYSAIKVKLTANNSTVYYGYGIKVDASGNGFIDQSPTDDGDPATWQPDSRIVLNKTYEMGVCVTPIAVSSNQQTWSEYREVAWIKDEAGSFII